jgi:hypothetical protein
MSRTEVFLFLACFFAFAYFNQGGGWNQNSRFAEVRAMAEEGRFAIDDFLVYRTQPEAEDLVRLPVHDTVFERGGKFFQLCWVDQEYNLVPVKESVTPPDAEKVPMVEMCASGDIAYVPKTGHFHPNKPPGTSFFALPGYWIAFQIERAFGMNPDHWWTMTVNAWIATVLSVGLVSALGCVCFFRLAREFAGGAEMPALLATLALAFGTTFFPFGTVLFDHNLTASLLVMAFYFIRCRETSAGRFFAGLCAGFAAITNYVAAVAVVFLGLYLLLARSRRWDLRPSVAYAVGVLPPFLLICWYGWVCFGSPFKINNDFQNPLFADPRGALGMFALPNAYVGALLLVSPYRGVFFLAPILILGVFGLVRWLREKTFVAEARLCLAIFGFFFLVNMSFNGYHGGFAAGPRYLVPGLPFLALPLVVAFSRWKRWSAFLFGASIFHQLLLTATDAQNALAVGGHARLDNEHRKDDFFCNIVSEYALPLFLTGRDGPLLDELLEAKIDIEADRLALTGMSEAERESQLAEKRAEWRASIDRGEKTPFLLAAIRGPVSVNPLGVYDGLLGYGNFEMDSPQAAWASCNLGEFVWPQARLSLLPLLLVSGGLSFAAWFCARRRMPLPPPAPIA